MEGYRCRTMSRDELALAIDWAAQEGWNPGLHDAASFHAADPEGFFVGELAGEPVASLSVVKYGRDFAFLGLYIVLPPFRGRGLGFRLWQHGMASAGGRQVGLDGVVAQQDNYRKSGFSLAWRNVRYEGGGGAKPPADARIVPLLTRPFEEVAAYDAAFFPAERRRFLRAWFQQADATAFAFVDDARLQGYGLVRRCRSGWKIGPLLADSEAAAEALYLSLAAQAAAGDAVFLDLPEPNAAARALARRHGMKMVFETARMYTGSAPPLAIDRLYGVTSFELG